MSRIANAVVRDAQQLLGVPKDGSWGPVTDDAYERAPTAIRASVDELLRQENYSRYTLRRVTYDLRSKDFRLRPDAISPSAIRPSNADEAVTTAASGRTLSDLARLPMAAAAPSPRIERTAMTAMTPSAKPSSSSTAQGPEIKLLGGRWISETDLDRLIARAGAAYGVSASTLKAFVNFEASKRREGGRTYYDVKSRSPGAGTYKGLGQMGDKAWSDIREKMGFSEPYSMVDDPEVNLRATAAYLKLNERYLRSKGYTGPLTPSVLYAAHNQGAGGFMRLLNGGAVRGKQGGIDDVLAQAVRDGKSVQA